MSACHLEHDVMMAYVPETLEQAAWRLRAEKWKIEGKFEL